MSDHRAMTNGNRPLALVVDDLKENLQVVCARLRREGYRVSPANSGAQALERAAAIRPDVILLDLMMPDIDGIEVCRRLKAQEAYRETPIIFLTACDEMAPLLEAFRAGAVDYVRKPFHTEELLARVGAHVELRRARERLVELNSQKNHFLSVAAHDLKSPLVTVSMLLQVFRERDAVAPDRRELMMDSAVEQIEAMVSLITDLLDFSKIERGEIQPELSRFDLCELARRQIEAMRELSDAKGQRIEFKPEAPSIMVELDARRVGQIMQNLISNALKFSPISSVARVSLSVKEEVALLEVADEGPGVTADDMQRLFKSFAKLSARPTGGESSTGLGLTIIKKLAESMRGRVWCESEPGRGASFFVELPLSPQCEPSAESVLPSVA